MSKSYLRIAFAFASILLISSPLLGTVNAASSSQFLSTSIAINSAFSAVSSANQNGGNVSSLTSQLNSAIAFFQKAQLENSSNPSQASADLQSAMQIAQQVSSEAPGIGSTLASARQTTVAESIMGLVAIVILGILAYIYGARIYRIIWMFVYRNHLVKRVNG